jgi:hypothetical protein
VTEGKWSLMTLGVRALQTRIERLAGDEAVLSDEMAEARAGSTVDRWAGEAGRIARELADMVEQVDRLIGPRESAGLPEVDEAADTAVVSLADCADEE